MLYHYLLTILRLVRKGKVHFAFKLGGLSLAIFCFMAIAIFVGYQLSFDRYHDDYKNVYRVTSQRKDNDVIEKYARAPVALGPLLAQLPGTYVTRLAFGRHMTFRIQDKVFDCESLAEVDSAVFDVFTFDFIKGNRKALHLPNSIVLTRSMAIRMFGTTDVLGEVVSLNGQSNLLQVTAVVEDMRSNSHWNAQALMRLLGEHTLATQNVIDPVVFFDQSTALYARLAKTQVETFRAQMHAVIDQYLPRNIQKEFAFDVSLQPLADIYLSSGYQYDFATHGDITYVYTFSMLGILLLLVAGINYVNLSIADYAGRTTETGVRRALGARQGQLFWQSSVEAICYSIAALTLALLSLYLAFPRLAALLDPNLRFDMLLSPVALGIVGAGLLLLIVLSCWLPARQLKSVRITESMKSSAGGFNSTLSRALLFTQFAVSVLCLFCTLIVGQQVAFVHQKGLGFDRRNLLVLSIPDEFTVKNLQTFKTELKRIPGITHVSNSSFRIGTGYWKDWYFVEDGDKVKEIELYEVFSDDELFATLNIPLLAGRTFNSQMPADSGAAFVINETAARELGWEDPVGKRIYTHPEEKGKWEGTVVGVVGDINISPLYEKVRPLVMRLPWQNEYPDGFIYVRYEGDPQIVASQIEQQYKSLMKGYPMALRYVDDLFNSSHGKEQKAFDSLSLGTLAIIFVAILGIFSMAAIISARRLKEFGIRKVMGASAQQIAVLNLNFFLRMALLANVSMLPFAWWIMSGWLDTFAYRTTITAAPFLMVTFISTLVVIVAGSHSAWKSGTLNPIDVIRLT
jgi:putative ABC transport system permease protein